MGEITDGFQAVGLGMWTKWRPYAIVATQGLLYRVSRGDKLVCNRNRHADIPPSKAVESLF